MERRQKQGPFTKGGGGGESENHGISKKKGGIFVLGGDRKRMPDPLEKGKREVPTWGKIPRGGGHEAEETTPDY